MHLKLLRLAAIAACAFVATRAVGDDDAATRKLAENDEVAFLPPVSGGAGPWTQVIEDPAGHFFALTRETIDARGIAQRLLRGQDAIDRIFVRR